MRVSLSWLREFVDLPEDVDTLRDILDDLGLVVEGVERVGEGLADVVVVRIDDIKAIEGADRVRLVTVETGSGPLDIVCGATNFERGQHVPLAPVGAVLPGGFSIAARTMRGVTSHGMLCSARELGLSEDHSGLMILDDVADPVIGRSLMATLGITEDVVFDISIEGNRPDAWCVEGVARDIAARLGRPVRQPAVANPQGQMTSMVASADIADPDLCGRLTVSVLRRVVVGESPAWVRRRLESAGMRPINNVVDASNLVMLELGQPTHPYDANKVAGRTLRARRARAGEMLVTLDGVERTLATAGRGLGDTGVDCVIVDGDDTVLGLAGIMGGASSEISANTTEVLLEAAYFDPMTIARSSKRHGLRSEASSRFERGVDPNLGLRAAARFVEVLRESVPGVEWLSEPLDVAGLTPEPATVTLRPHDVARTLGVEIPAERTRSLLEALGFSVAEEDGSLRVTAPSSRADVRTGAAGRADVLEEVARLYSYRALPRRTPTWDQPGGLSDRQVMRRRLRDVLVAMGMDEVWTPTLVSESEFALLGAGTPIRVTNPLAAEESVLRRTLLTGLVQVWQRNVERGRGDVVVGEFGHVFTHPDDTTLARRTRGGAGGTLTLHLPAENERVTWILARPGDDAASAVAWWSAVSDRLGLSEVVVRRVDSVPAGFHPTRTGCLIDQTSGATLGWVGEVDPALRDALRGESATQRLAVVDLDLDALSDPTRATRRPLTAVMPSRFPSAHIDLALVTPDGVHADDLARALREASPLVESVTLFDVYRGTGVADGSRSLAYAVRLISHEATLSDKEVAAAREVLIGTAEGLGARLR